MRFASVAWPRPGLAWPAWLRPGLGEPRSASIAGLHQHSRKGKIVLIKTRRYKRPELTCFWRRSWTSLVRGSYCQLDVGLCDVDVFLHWNIAAEEGAWVGFKTGPSRRHRIQPAEGPFLDPPCKRKRVSKRGQKVTRIKSGPPGGSSLGPFLAPSMWQIC